MYQVDTVIVHCKVAIQGWKWSWSQSQNKGKKWSRRQNLIILAPQHCSYHSLGTIYISISPTILRITGIFPSLSISLFVSYNPLRSSSLFLSYHSLCCSVMSFSPLFFHLVKPFKLTYFKDTNGIRLEVHYQPPLLHFFLIKRNRVSQIMFLF